MAQINVSNLTFCYEGSYDNVFEQVSFSIDTDWKLGFIGRNGKGKTTFLNLLLGKYDFEGSITGPVLFDYFPYCEEDIRASSGDVEGGLGSKFGNVEGGLGLNSGDVEGGLGSNSGDVEGTLGPSSGNAGGSPQPGPTVLEMMEGWRPEYELWKVCRELELLKLDADVLYRPYGTLSQGERTKVMLAVLFSEERYFLLIDEPTNHLDVAARDAVRDYLNQKQGFILVSHDRALLDACVDHVLVLEREQILLEKGNFSSWWENKGKRDQFEQSEHAKLKKEIHKLEEAAKRTALWAERSESSKIGFSPEREPDRSIGTRSYIGEKTRRMQQRRKNLERRQQGAIEGKSKLLKNLEKPVELKLMPLAHHKEVYLKAEGFQLFYQEKLGSGDVTDDPGQQPGPSREREAVRPLSLELRRGECLVLQGANGSGKSSFLKAVLTAEGAKVLGGLPAALRHKPFRTSGQLSVAAGLKISYINQDTSFLSGSLDAYIRQQELDPPLMKAILRQLDFERAQFDKPMEEYSQGQKKKVLIAGSLLQQAHLYVWDEPLNYIDVFSRMQIEQLIRTYRPTMLLVEHDRAFAEKIGANIVLMPDPY